MLEQNDLNNSYIRPIENKRLYTNIMIALHRKKKTLVNMYVEMLNADIQWKIVRKME